MFEQNKASEIFITSSTTGHENKKQDSLRNSVKVAIQNYLEQLDGQSVTQLYDLVLAEVEQPLLDIIMQHTGGNQTKAAKMMGMNRGTLRKKLKLYNMD